MQIELFCLGEVMAEIRHHNDGFALSFAGDTFNTAVYAARQGANVAFATRVGKDPLSKALFKQLESESINADFVSQDDTKNIGIYAVATDSAGDRSFSYWRSDSAARQLFTKQATQFELPAAKIIYVSGITLAILHPVAREYLFAQLSKRRQEGSLICFDSNYRSQLWEDKATAQQVMLQMWQLTDIALPTMEDEIELHDYASEEEVLSCFAEKDWTRCAIKRDVRGPVVPGQQPQEYPPADTVVDTTAAGDSFNGAYLAAYLAGDSETECLTKGHMLAREVVGVAGAIMPK